ncbi:MAG: TRM11 family SAM-dependent methyltransferase [Candidatus Njordarchaeales archaeon]
MPINSNHQILIFTIKNKHPIALEEIKAILESLRAQVKFDRIERGLVLLKTDLKTALILSQRASLIKYVGLLLGSTCDEAIEKLVKLIKEAANESLPFSFSILTSDFSKIDEMASKIRRVFRNSYVNLDNPLIPIEIMKLEENSFILIPLRSSRLDITRYQPQYRPYAPSATMDAEISRLIVNLTRCNYADIFLDPFCGSGSILLEASRIGCYTLGLDINPRLVYGAQFNFQSLLHDDANVVIGDASRMPFQDDSIDAIGTDPPYGRSALVIGKNLKDLYRAFLQESYRVLRRKKHICFCAPLEMRDYLNSLIREIGFEKRTQFAMKVHKGLTRLITVLFVP